MHVFCIFVFAPVQRNWARFTWKGALEVHPLLLLLLFHYVTEWISNRLSLDKWFWFYPLKSGSGFTPLKTASRAEDPRFESRLCQVFSVSSHTRDLKIGTPVAALPGAWSYRVSTRTGWPDVSILWLGEIESWICSFCLSVAAHKIVCADSSLRYTGMLLGR